MHTEYRLSPHDPRLRRILSVRPKLAGANSILCFSLQGFSIDGKTGSEEEFHSYQNKCVIVNGQGESEDDALDGFVMKDMLVQNCG